MVSEKKNSNLMKQTVFTTLKKESKSRTKSFSEKNLKIKKNLIKIL